MSALLSLLFFLFWAVLWVAGGWLVMIGLNLPRRERLVLGIGFGLIAQLWLSNLLAQVLPVTVAFWGGSLIMLAVGLAFAWPRLKEGWNLFYFSPGQMIALGLIVYVFTIIGFGLDIFDDYQNLPTVSLMATGSIPPHFALDPKFIFGYHYLLLLFGAQLMRIGNIFPWTGLDFARGLVFGLMILCAYLWTRRMTRSHLAGVLGGVFAAFSSGARWILLFLPPAMVESISKQVTLIGSGSITDKNLAQALLKPWAIQGAGPMAFPFAFSNGINDPAVMVHNGTGVIVPLIVMLILLLYRRWRDWKMAAVLVILLSAWALGSEFDFLALLPNLIVAVIVYLFLQKTKRIPREAFAWIGVMVAALAFAAFQGGVLTSIAQDTLQRLLGHVAEGYHTFGLTFSILPSVVSAHLGRLTLTNPAQLLLALLEIGPVLLALPLAFVWGVKMIRAQRWWEAALVTGAATGMIALFVQYAGSAGISANSRLLNSFITPATLYAAPLGWVWAKKKAEAVWAGLGAVGFVAIFGGLVLFGVELIAAQKPVLPDFIHDMDAHMSGLYWNKLEPGAQVFDPVPVRAVTVFGRYSNSYDTWYVPKTDWEALVAHPDPHVLNRAGYRYVYFGIYEWEEQWDAVARALLQDPCVKVVDQVNGIRAPDDYRKDFRRLLDISACK